MGKQGDLGGPEAGTGRRVEGVQSAGARAVSLPICTAGIKLTEEHQHLGSPRKGLVTPGIWVVPSADPQGSTPMRGVHPSGMVEEPLFLGGEKKWDNLNIV